MKPFLTCALIVVQACCYAQNAIDWDGSYQLELSDFQSAASEIGPRTSYTMNTGSLVDFAYQMSSSEFMFTKNFNSKVSCTFKRNSAMIAAPDSAIALDLVGFAQYQFDLAELYARKLRKSIYEKKGAFSNPSFFQPLFEENQEEMAIRYQCAAKSSDLGKHHEVLAELRREVLTGIEELADFCKSCKPSKKKK